MGQKFLGDVVKRNPADDCLNHLALVFKERTRLLGREVVGGGRREREREGGREGGKEVGARDWKGEREREFISVQKREREIGRMGRSDQSK